MFKKVFIPEEKTNSPQDEGPHVLVGATREEFPDLLMRRGFKLGVEVGSQKGEYAEYLLSKWTGSLFVIDVWEPQSPDVYVDTANVAQGFQEQFMQEAKMRLAKFENRAFIVRGLSPAVANNFQDDSLDFVYLDGNHDYPAVAVDLKAWWPKIRKGGMMSGHDFLDGFTHNCKFGVERAVREFASEVGCSVIHVSKETWPQWSFDKL